MLEYWMRTVCEHMDAKQQIQMDEISQTLLEEGGTGAPRTFCHFSQAKLQYMAVSGFLCVNQLWNELTGSDEEDMSMRAIKRYVHVSFFA